MEEPECGRAKILGPWLIGSYQNKTEAGSLVLVKSLEFDVKQIRVQGQAWMRRIRVT